MAGAKDLGGGRFELSGGQIIHNVHHRGTCLNEFCTIHNWSDHGMTAWPQIMTPAGYDQSGVQRIYPEMYRQCPHNGLHHDPDAPGYTLIFKGNTVKCWNGCDGCCQRTREVNRQVVQTAISELRQIKEGLE